MDFIVGSVLMPRKFGINDTYIYKTRSFHFIFCKTIFNLQYSKVCVVSNHNIDNHITIFYSVNIDNNLFNALKMYICFIISVCIYTRGIYDL